MKNKKSKPIYEINLQNPPLSYAETENGVLVGKGIAFEFLSFLQEKYEFNYSVVLPIETDNSTANGIFGMLDTEVSHFVVVKIFLVIFE